MELGNIKEIKFSPQEEERQDQMTTSLCPNCHKPMTVGECEAGYCCSECYWNALAEYQ